MKTVLITGGTGFIGSHTAIALQQAGYKVLIVDNLSNSKLSVVKAILQITGIRPIFINVDCTNFSELENVFRTNRIDAIIHMAGYKAVAESQQKPLDYYQNNIVSTLNILELMQVYQISHLVFSSSATVYGNVNTSEGYKEEMPTGLGISNPYGRTKYMIEQILIDAERSHPNLSITLLRYFNPIGAHPSGILGEDPNGLPNNLMPVIMRVFQGKLKKLQIYGNDYPTPDGTCIRDYLHVVDLAEGHVAALKYQKPGLAVYNLGTGMGTSVSDLVSLFEEISCSRIPKEYTSRRPGDAAVVYADPTKANTELKWKASLSVKDAIQDSLRYLANTRNEL